MPKTRNKQLESQTEQRQQAKENIKVVKAQKAAKVAANGNGDSPLIAVFVGSNGQFLRAEWPGIPSTAVPTILEQAKRQIERDLGVRD